MFRAPLLKGVIRFFSNQADSAPHIQTVRDRLTKKIIEATELRAQMETKKSEIQQLSRELEKLQNSQPHLPEPPSKPRCG